MNRLFLLVAVILLGFAPGIANGATALLLGGRGGYAELTDEQMATALGGYFADYDRVSVPFPGLADDFGYSLEVGADNLYAAVYATPGPKTIGGVSEGAPAVDEVLRRLMNDTNRPPPEELNAMIYGSPSKLFFDFSGLRHQELPVTPYDVIVIKAEFDGAADFPDNWFNLLAVVNAVMGGEQLHVAGAWTDISTVPTRYNIVTNELGGTTTTILIPTTVLPLLKPYVDGGFAPEFINFLDSLLRPIIDSAYNRPEMQVGIPHTLAEQDLSALAGVAPPVAPAALAPSGAENRALVETHQTSPPAAPTINDVSDRPILPVPAVIADYPEGVKETDHETKAGAANFEEAIDEGAIDEEQSEVETESGEGGVEPDEAEVDPQTLNENAESQENDAAGNESTDTNNDE